MKNALKLSYLSYKERLNIPSLYQVPVKVCLVKVMVV